MAEFKSDDSLFKSLTGYIIPGNTRGYNQEDSFIITGVKNEIIMEITGNDKIYARNLHDEKPDEKETTLTEDEELGVDKFMQQYGYPPVDSDEEYP